jgi:hypothetical protein
LYWGLLLPLVNHVYFWLKPEKYNRYIPWRPIEIGDSIWLNSFRLKKYSKKFLEVSQICFLYQIHTSENLSVRSALQIARLNQRYQGSKRQSERDMAHIDFICMPFNRGKNINIEDVVYSAVKCNENCVNTQRIRCNYDVVSCITLTW